MGSEKKKISMKDDICRNRMERKMKKCVYQFATLSMIGMMFVGCGNNATIIDEQNEDIASDDLVSIQNDALAESEENKIEVEVEEILSQNKYASLEIGDVVEFGNFEGNTEWLVLDKEEDKMMLITKDLIKLDKFNEEQARAIWENCTLRSWLNSEYYESAFSDDEKSLILETTNKNYDNSIYYLGQGGPDTIDKVFLLSVDEEKELFSSNSARRAYIDDTKYEWWTRTPGNNQYTAVFVNADGDDVLSGAGVGEAEIGVRPAMWIDITK